MQGTSKNADTDIQVEFDYLRTLLEDLEQNKVNKEKVDTSF
jgi:hypothetical protein